MNTIELTNEEHELLEQVLQNALMTIEQEISHSSTNDYKEYLRHRRDLLNRLMVKAQHTIAVTT